MTRRRGPASGSFEDVVRKAAAKRAAHGTLTPAWMAAVGRVCGMTFEQKLRDEYTSNEPGTEDTAGKLVKAFFPLVGTIVGPLGVAAVGAAAAATLAAVTAAKNGNVSDHVDELERVRGLHGEVKHLPASRQKDRLLELLVEDLIDS